MAEDDKYPESSGRRRFVKGVVGSAGMAGIGAAGAVSVSGLTNPTGQGGGQTTYFGVENTDGPAPRAMPMIPIEIDDQGYIKGRYPETKEIQRQGQTVTVARMDLGGITYEVDWFQYCGVQDYQGLDPDYEGDNYFRYTGGPSSYDWQPSSGRVNVSDFENYETWTNGIGPSGIGKPAMASWRSQDTNDTIPVQIIRSTRIQEKLETETGPAIDWLKAATQDGFMAILNKCTHFCCVPGFRSSTYGDAGNRIYCPCHQSIYNPFSIVKRRFTAFPRPEDS
ncbi:ubiquinol-cytochrome c reductase iron-sulfur subunit [Halobacterium zhouii]|uniref:ubiquinol-cytochrome c reductase iron-sulfur subunit n=1 Tax=Halobacterium zhouii TaxID=2902624 RepID=UPI001E5B1E79|nr:ubiquinol-cytochrome c reductase iron-sulfur subunit [Halobacterium zhouii]